MISTVEEGVVSLLQHGGGNSRPLLLSRIYTSGIVCASVKEEGRVIGCILDSVQEAGKVEADGRRIIVGIVHRFDSDISKDGMVVG